MNLVPAARPSLSRLPSAARLRADWPRVVAVFESPWVAYGLLLALQLKVIWGMWSRADVSDGDTASYYTMAWMWHSSAVVNVGWSPLYTAFYGSFLFLNADPLWATAAHRVVIVLASAVLTLAVLRQLLPPAVAWACGAWWAVLPIVFNTLYEVHLFALLPVLGVWLLLLTARTPWRRAAGLGLLGTSVVLVRNELSVAFGVLALGLLVIERRRLRRGEGPGTGRTVLAYAVALAVAAVPCGLAYARSVVKYPELSAAMKAKHVLNMRQVYPFYYSQKHPEWSLNAMTHGFGLMRATFGTPEPTLREMIAANPRAMGGFFVWNLSLAPSGIQLLLFNRASGSIHPDYFLPSDTRLRSAWAAVGLAALGVVWATGLVALRRGWRERWREWVSLRAAGWLGIAAVACVAPAIILTQRPRPSYLFGFGVGLVAVTGMCAWAATTRWRLAGRLRRAMPVVMLTLVIGVPTHSVALGETGPRIHRNAVARLGLHRGEILVRGRTTVGSSDAAGWYLWPTASVRYSTAAPVRTDEVNFAELLVLSQEWKPGEPLESLLARARADFLYLDEFLLRWLEGTRPGDARAFIDGRDVPGWALIDGGDTPGDRWRLYRKER